MLNAGRIALFSFLGIAAVTAGCAVDPQEETSAGSEDALTQQECTPIVQKAQQKTKADCAQKLADANAKDATRASLEKAVVSAVSAFGTELSSYSGTNASTVKGILAECSAIGCSGELRSGDTKAECTVERAFLQGACYVRNIPELKSAVKGIDFNDEIARLEDAVSDMKAWPGLVSSAAWLRTEHAACSKIAGSDAERTALNEICRASCDDDNATDLSKVNNGHGSACVPPNYQAVKDDFGNQVTCGSMGRVIMSRFACECKVDNNKCTQFAALAASSEHHAPCKLPNGQAGTQKVRWNAGARLAELVCAR
jgi:hypothetical protein